ncbi:DNA helicase [Oricola sp.]|uniref:DNA helicase n=1 Tax=Oricola sp. TaxID=1979950 RepID=UPI0025E008E0|nr:DNA helicase [Oricola sp.]MCI5074923.1 DNA helicase [Oricola sp.]
MKLSAPLYALKREAKALSRTESIPLHAALDRIARREGFQAWSLLMARAAARLDARDLHAALEPGDLLLLGARPGQGKTLMSLRLAVEAMRQGRPAFFFTLEYTPADVAGRFAAIGEDPGRHAGLFAFDCSDEISAAYVVERLADAPRGTLAVIDYLQLLDQRRDKPPLMQQVAALKAFCRTSGVTMVLLSQIDRSFDPATRPCPGPQDVRLPNPLDLSLFDRTCFLHGDEVRLGARG